MSDDSNRGFSEENGHPGSMKEGGDGRDRDVSGGMSERLSALMPILMTMIAERSEKRGLRAAFQLQMLFWGLGVVVDQLDATKGVVERARDRLRAIDQGRTGAKPDDGTDW
ncbi:MAG: hypothetical protein K9H25_20920 [Rhodospirillum sp.]|nr:hypothetical protein [Rhodospirillum sp.]MCF8492092.1 hypothetical protein [Rhodospirillum sp.]MCF8501891.1 hypothetical protein [Rhodospirillum sp.]